MYKPTYNRGYAQGRVYGQSKSYKKAGQRRRTAVKRQQVNPYVELKGMDTSISFTEIPETTNDNTYSTVLNLVQTGTGSWNRVGKRIHPKSLRIKGNVIWESVPTASGGDSHGNVLRMVIVYDKQPSGNAIPNFDDIFGHTDQGGTETATFYDSIKYDNTDRFSVVRDKFIDLNLYAVSSVGTTKLSSYAYYCDEYIKLSSQPSVYSGQSVPMTISDVSTGAYYIFMRVLRNEADSRTDFDGIARLRYTD